MFGTGAGPVKPVRHGNQPKKNHAPLQTIKAGYPMQGVAVDIIGPLPESETGNKYVLVASDYFTKWTEVYAIPNQEATTVAQKLTDEMFCRFSPPEQLHSDQGRQFESQVTVFPRIDRVRSINFSLSKLRAIIEGALYLRARSISNQHWLNTILACVNLWSRLCTRVHYYILRGVFEGALYFTTH